MSGKDYWERHARRYDASLRWVFGKPMARVLELSADAVRGKQSVLEVAAGTGIVTSALAQTSGSVLATDYAEAMVEVLERRVSEEALENVTCEQADVYSLPYADGQFDAVVAANVLHLVPDLAAAMAAVQRVTKPGGTFVAPTFCHNETKTSWLASRIFALTGFPSNRRFTLHSLQQALAEHGLLVTRAEILPGLIPIGFVAGQFPAGTD